MMHSLGAPFHFLFPPKAELIQQQSLVWLTGLSGAGKTTIARQFVKEMCANGFRATMLDGDDLRRGLNADLGFTPRDREENIRRAGQVARLFTNAGVFCVASFISPYRKDRDWVRSLMPPCKFVEVFVNAPLEVCEQRDTKGLYARARARQIADFTGISAPYEPPLEPEIEICTDKLSIEESVACLRDYFLKKQVWADYQI